VQQAIKVRKIKHNFKINKYNLLLHLIPCCVPCLLSGQNIGSISIKQSFLVCLLPLYKAERCSWLIGSFHKLVSIFLYTLDLFFFLSPPSYCVVFSPFTNLSFTDLSSFSFLPFFSSDSSFDFFVDFSYFPTFSSPSFVNFSDLKLFN
jgi:hypothetical protein